MNNKGLLAYVVIILILVTAGLISSVWLGPHNVVTELAEKELDVEIEKGLNLAPGSVNIDLDIKDAHT